MLSKFEDFKLQSQDGVDINRTETYKYLGVKLDEKWSWKPHIWDLLRKLGHRLSIFNRIKNLVLYIIMDWSCHIWTTQIWYGETRLV